MFLAMTPPTLRPLGIGETLDVAIKIYLSNAWTLFRLVLLVVAPVQLVSVLLAASATPTQDDFNYNAETGEFHFDQGIWTAIAGGSVLVLLTVISATLASGLCFKAIVDAYLGTPSNWREALSFVSRRIHSILWITFLAGLIGILGFILCIIPGVYLWVGFTVAVPVLLTERIKGYHALSRSRSLVKGRWWSVFAVVLIGGILTSIVSGALSALDGVVAVTSDDPTSIGALTISFLTGTVASVVTTPLTAAIVVVIYIDLRVRHEAFDLQLLAGQLGVDPPEMGVSPYAPLVDDPPPAGGSQPPYWPPPPGWKPTPPSPGDAPLAASEAAPPADGSQPPYWPPPPGWKPTPPPAPDVPTSEPPPTPPEAPPTPPETPPEPRE